MAGIVACFGVLALMTTRAHLPLDSRMDSPRNGRANGIIRHSSRRI